jgi:hypothetical protein
MSKPSELEMGADLEAQKASLMVDNETDDGDDDLHPHGHDAAPEDVKRIAGVSAKPPPKASQSSFIIWTAVNTLATIGIVKNILSSAIDKTNLALGLHEQSHLRRCIV